MPRVAKLAMVSEATAYRYFPDLVSLLQEALDGMWPDPAQALAPVAGSRDPVERVAAACEYLLRGVHAYQGAVRAMISSRVTVPASARARPGIRFGLIDYALAPFAAPPRLKLDLAVVVSAEAFFTLTDLCGLSPDEAIDSARHTAAALTRAAFCDHHSERTRLTTQAEPALPPAG
jgi:AcrR family transcriptional regulator